MTKFRLALKGTLTRLLLAGVLVVGVFSPAFALSANSSCVADVADPNTKVSVFSNETSQTQRISLLHVPSSRKLGLILTDGTHEAGYILAGFEMSAGTFDLPLQEVSREGASPSRFPKSVRIHIKNHDEGKIEVRFDNVDNAETQVLTYSGIMEGAFSTEGNATAGFKLVNRSLCCGSGQGYAAFSWYRCFLCCLVDADCAG